MIVESTGNLLDASVDALVNPVNTFGVMGTMFVTETSLLAPRFIVNFPTKKHWGPSSQIEYIRDGLVDLIVQVRLRHINSIAIPALGCGLGGLAWSDVRPLIETAFEQVPDVRVLLFAPR